jgi:hypothetical protein
MTPRLPLRLHGLRIPRPPRRGCVLQVEGLRQGGGGGHDNPRRRWHGGEAPGSDGGVAFGVGSGARGAVVVRGMTVGAAATERGVGEGVLDAPSVFEPRSERLIVS